MLPGEGGTTNSSASFSRDVASAWGRRPKTLRQSTPERCDRSEAICCSRAGVKSTSKCLRSAMKFDLQHSNSIEIHTLLARTAKSDYFKTKA